MRRVIALVSFFTTQCELLRYVRCYVTLGVTLRYVPYLILQISYFSQNRSRFLYRLNQLFAVLKHTRIAENRSIITQHDISRPLTPEATDGTLS